MNKGIIDDQEIQQSFDEALAGVQIMSQAASEAMMYYAAALFKAAKERLNELEGIENGQ